MGVLPRGALDRAGNGLGRALTAYGLARATARGAGLVQLYVDAASEPAIRTYRALGFSTDHRDLAYALEVEAGAPA